VYVLLAVCLLAPGLFVGAQETQAAEKTAGPTSREPGSAGTGSGGATKEEVEQLRRRLAAQEETIQQLKAMVQKLADAKEQPAPAGDASMLQPASGTLGEARAVPTVLRLSGDPLSPDSSFNQQQNLTPKKENAPGSPAGWNGEHFFLRSPDGQFTLLPQGYLNTNYSFYNGDGAPPNTFSVRRARFGFVGTYGSTVDYAFLFDAAAANGIAIRDMYVNAKPVPQFQIQAGQFKEPFSQEVGTGDTNVEFLERSLITVLYPSAAGTFRAPGTVIHGDLHGGAIQYWAGIFNGKGIIANNTTNELETVGRLRFSPWKNSKGSVLKGFSFGGSIAHGRSRGLSNELSFSGTTNDSAFVWFPQFRINGAIERYNGEFLWLTGTWGLRTEYTQILEKRDGVGSEAAGGIGFQTLPGVVGKGGYITLTRLLTGEREPENAIPKVAHPVIGPPTPGVEGGTPGMGAWQVKFRYSWIEGKAGGQSFASPFTPASVPAFSAHTDQFSMGVNWYLNYWMLVKFDLNMDRLHDPSVGGVLPQNYYVATQGLQFRF
jgi:phosphate-selective porin